MKPSPSESVSETKKPGDAFPPLPTAFTASSGSFSTHNRRVPSNPVLLAYPWLLILSTSIAALFCLMYINKPIFPASSGPLLIPSLTSIPSTPAKRKSGSKTNTSAELMPNADRLPGEQATPAEGNGTTADSRRNLPEPPSSSAFEETNLRIQHILTAQTPTTPLARIDLDVPVLYQSRNLRWTSDDVADARKLVIRLIDYQEKSKLLRAEGNELLTAWNHLVSRSIPASDLRADSPSLPTNQENATDAPRPTDLISTESIQIQATEK
jgi:hypothetical protein